MNRSLAAIAAAAMLAASVPTIGFADESSSSSDASVSSSSSSSATTSSSSSVSTYAHGNEWMKPCDDLKGLLKAQCIVKNNPGKKTGKNRVARRAEDTALRIHSNCSSMEGADRMKCLRQNGKRGIKSFIMKKSKYDQQHTIRGRKVEASSSESSED